MFSKRKWVLLVSVLLVFSLLVVSGCGSTPSGNAKPADQQQSNSQPAKAAWKPTQPVSLVVPFAPGGSTDLLARTIEKYWSKYCPQPVQIVNKTGGGGVTGAVFVAHSKPDGYTLEIGYGSGHDNVMPYLEKVEYDPFKDLEPIALMSIHSVLVAVPVDSPFKSMKDVLEWAKKENKPITAAVSTTAGAVDVVMRGIGKTSGVTVTPVPHAGGSQALATLVGGQTTIGGGHPAEIISQLKAGRIRGIAIATPERDPSLPDIPTLKEQGINFSTWGSVKGIAAPKGTPKEIIDYYADVFKKISEDPDYKKTCQDMLLPVQYKGPEEFKKFFKDVYDDYGKLVKELGLDKK